MAKNTIHAAVTAVGASTWRDPQMPIHVSGKALEIEANPVSSRGKQLSIEMNANTARWVGEALLRYALKPAMTLRDMSADHFFVKAFDEELKLGLERAVAAGEKAVEEWNERQAAIAERRTAAAQEGEG